MSASSAATLMPGRAASLSAGNQVWFIVATLIGAQYILNALVYFGFLGEFFRTRLFLLGGLTALFFAFCFGGKQAVIEMLTPYRRLPRTQLLFWTLFALLWNFPIIVASIPLHEWISGQVPVFHRPYSIGFARVAETIVLLTLVAICDELFWIGFVLPRLVAAGHGHAKASLIIGALWGFTYVPLIFTGFFVAQGLTIDTLVLGWFAIAPLYIWLYFRTSSAVLVVIMSVSMQISNWTVPLLPEPPDFDNGPVAMQNLITLLLGLGLWAFAGQRAPNNK